MQDGFGIIRVLHILRDTQDVSTLADVVLDVLVVALVRELGHLDFLRGKLLVEIEQVHGGRWQVLDIGQKDSRLQLWHRRLKLRRNERERLVFNAQSLVQVNRLWHQVSVEFVEVRVEQRREILGEIIGLLEARAKAISEGSDIRYVLVLTDFGLFLNMVLELGIIITA